MVGWIVAGATFLSLLMFIVLNVWNIAKARSARRARDSWERNYEIANAAYNGVKGMWDKREAEYIKQVACIGLERDEARKQLTKADEQVLALELQLAEEKSKHADGKAEHDTVELPEQEPAYYVVPESERPARPARGKRTKATTEPA